MTDRASAEGLLRVAAQRVVDEYDNTHLTHDVAYENVAAEIDQLRLVLLGRDHLGLRPEYRPALRSQMTDRTSAEGLPTHCSVCGRRILTNRTTGKCWKHRD